MWFFFQNTFEPLSPERARFEPTYWWPCSDVANHLFPLDWKYVGCQFVTAHAVRYKISSPFEHWWPSKCFPKSLHCFLDWQEWPDHCPPSSARVSNGQPEPRRSRRSSGPIQLGPRLYASPELDGGSDSDGRAAELDRQPGAGVRRGHVGLSHLLGAPLERHKVSQHWSDHLKATHLTPFNNFWSIFRSVIVTEEHKSIYALRAT